MSAAVRRSILPGLWFSVSWLAIWASITTGAMGQPSYAEEGMEGRTDSKFVLSFQSEFASLIIEIFAD